MKIKSFEVYGLFGKPERREMHFSEDINIITGKNGAGKTSAMKLMWYIMSGNIELALTEINFQKATLHTDDYICTVHKLNNNTCRVEIIDKNGNIHTFEDEHDDDGHYYTSAEDQANPILMEFGGSVFLPTFRRIEGGFTLNTSRIFKNRTRGKGEIEEALAALSSKLTNRSHAFVASISSVDIVEILLRQFANLSQEYNSYQQNTSQEIIERIRAHKTDSAEKDRLVTANRLIDDIKLRVEDMESVRARIMNPMEAFREVVEQLFKHVGIKIDSRLNFGDAASAVNSHELSAGEKQMLSFLCYNAFFKNSIFFIDEPELSLHVDWQRRLFTVLRRQNSTNQFIFATHSPFIYSKYPDKEICLDSDRGDSEEEQ